MIKVKSIEQAREEAKRYGNLADKILERLAEIELKHLNSLGA
jgi:hypothetical protein